MESGMNPLLKIKSFPNEYKIFGTLFVIGNRLQWLGDSFFEEITSKQWFVLTLLDAMEGYSPSLKELSAAAGSTHQNIKQIALKLEAKGYLTLTRDERDARQLRIYMTSKCRELQDKYEKKQEAFIKKLYSGFSSNELNCLWSGLSKMEQNLKEMKPSE